MSFLDFFKKKKKEDEIKESSSDNREREIPVEFENKTGDRFLKIKNSDCGIILHDDGELDIIFTKFNNENQNVSDTEEALMAFALFLKQPGFLQLILEEFRKIASTTSQKL